MIIDAGYLRLIQIVKIWSIEYKERILMQFTNVNFVEHFEEYFDTKAAILLPSLRDARTLYNCTMLPGYSDVFIRLCRVMETRESVSGSMFSRLKYEGYKISRTLKRAVLKKFYKAKLRVVWVLPEDEYFNSLTDFLAWRTQGSIRRSPDLKHFNDTMY